MVKDSNLNQTNSISAKEEIKEAIKKILMLRINPKPDMVNSIQKWDGASDSFYKKIIYTKNLPKDKKEIEKIRILNADELIKYAFNHKDNKYIDAVIKEEIFLIKNMYIDKIEEYFKSELKAIDYKVEIGSIVRSNVKNIVEDKKAWKPLLSSYKDSLKDKSNKKDFDILLDKLTNQLILNIEKEYKQALEQSHIEELYNQNIEEERYVVGSKSMTAEQYYKLLEEVKNQKNYYNDRPNSSTNIYFKDKSLKIGALKNLHNLKRTIDVIRDIDVTDDPYKKVVKEELMKEYNEKGFFKKIWINFKARNFDSVADFMMHDLQQKLPLRHEKERFSEKDLNIFITDKSTLGILKKLEQKILYLDLVDYIENTKPNLDYKVSNEVVVEAQNLIPNQVSELSRANVAPENEPSQEHTELSRASVAFKNSIALDPKVQEAEIYQKSLDANKKHTHSLAKKESIEAKLEGQPISYPSESIMPASVVKNIPRSFQNTKGAQWKKKDAPASFGVNRS